MLALTARSSASNAIPFVNTVEPIEMSASWTAADMTRGIVMLLVTKLELLEYHGAIRALIRFSSI